MNFQTFVDFKTIVDLKQVAEKLGKSSKYRQNSDISTKKEINGQHLFQPTIAGGTSTDNRNSGDISINILFLG